MMLRLILTVCEKWRYPLLTPKQPDVIIDPSWPLEKRIWWALEAISDHCDGAKRLDGVGYSKYDRPVADRLQGLELAKWIDKDIDDGLHLIRKYRGQLERMGVKMEDVIGDMGMVVTIDDDNSKSAGAAMATQTEETVEMIQSPSNSQERPMIIDDPTPKPIVDRPKRVNVALDNTDITGSGADLYTEFLTGAAGTGKTHEIRQRIANDPNYALLTATTGIAAINLGTITLNSALGYFNTESLEESMIKGYLEKKLRDIIEQGYKNIVIDELSMMDKRQLDMIYEGIRRVNERSEWHDKEKLGLIVTGDFCQLPPIGDKGGKDKSPPWAFKADCWPKFDANTIKLTKCWRQSDQKFLDAINLIRSGNGRDGVRILRDIGITFTNESDKSFDGTTIIAKNDAVDGFNFVAHSRVNGQMIRVANSRWGKLRKEWDHIPAELSLKVGAYAMILTNDTPAFTYVNGDCGHVKDFNVSATGEPLQDNGAFGIELVRNNSQVEIAKITRFNHQKDAPRELGEDNKSLRAAYRYDPDNDDPPLSPAFDIKARKWIVGGITYYPLRLAYASTVHKSQGLSLDRVQMDVNNHFMGAPGMCYVALSRAKTPEGLRIIGDPETMIERVKVSPEVLKWL